MVLMKRTTTYAKLKNAPRHQSAPMSMNMNMSRNSSRRIVQIISMFVMMFILLITTETSTAPSWSVRSNNPLHNDVDDDVGIITAVVNTQSEYLHELKNHVDDGGNVKQILIHIPSNAVHVNVEHHHDGFAEQIHLSATGDATEMVISWITARKCEEPNSTHVIYGLHDNASGGGGGDGGLLLLKAKGYCTSYNYNNYTSGGIHFGTMTDLLPGKKYDYYVVDRSAISDIFSFNALPLVKRDTPMVFSVVGDLGQTNYSVQTIKHMMQNNGGMILHNGDLSYADKDQSRWDNWGRLIQPLAATTPWMVCPGNHEDEGSGDLKYASYNHRFLMPSKQSHGSKNLWYSFDVASAHIIALNSYSAYDVGSPQYNWLLFDLGKVDRNITPWIFVMLHSPWYNSNSAHHNEVEEVGMRAAMEPIMFKYRVDIIFSGHTHSYERMHPVYKNITMPGAPTYIGIGDGGNREGLAAHFLKQPSWSAFREAAYGHGRIEIFNSTHAYWSWHRDLDSEGVVSDSVWLIHT